MTIISFFSLITKQIFYRMRLLIAKEGILFLIQFSGFLLEQNFKFYFQLLLEQFTWTNTCLIMTPNGLWEGNGCGYQCFI